MVTLNLSSDNNLTPFLLFTASSSNFELKSSLTAAESAHSKKVDINFFPCAKFDFDRVASIYNNSDR